MNVPTYDLSVVPYGLLADVLVMRATKARLMAYQPYSRYMVGAAILGTKGSVFYTGCNVECADYDGTHAEENALGAMVLAGERDPLLIAVVGGLEGGELSYAPPCGKCRQKIIEFSQLNGREIYLVVTGEKHDELRLMKMSDLLPGAFGPAKIGVDVVK